ncbi:LarC family nickel insertion protein [Candidatus Lokiarchaeum ossiferum]|uniref:LarC family nickel insertion protein n=1 Tax=Candidatus Lokiarchaeum ossiferum TaxID=2951803 RepID=UPI00352C66CF
MKKILFIDCGYSGVSGDLLISSLAGIIGRDEMLHFLTKVLSKIMPNSNYHCDLISKISSGIEGLYLDFHAHSKDQEQHVEVLKSHEDIHVSQPHSHHHQSMKNSEKSHNPHHHYSIANMEVDLKDGLSVHPFSAKAVEVALFVLRQLIEAESQIHGVPIDKVHLHEIGSRDTILDICGVIFGLEKVGVFNEIDPVVINISPVAVGGGQVKCAHGIMPVPAPATTKLLEIGKIAFKKGPVDFELATPTGIALLASLNLLGYLTNDISDYNQMILKSGIGVGTLQFPDRANILRSFLYQAKSSPKTGNSHFDLFLANNSLGNTHEVYKVETNVDDVRGEILGNLITLLVKSGALDVSIIPTLTKKNRPGQLIAVVCHDKDIERLSSILISETGSLGVRISSSSRICLKREIVSYDVMLDKRMVNFKVKIARNKKDQIIQQKIEFDDLEKISKILDKPIRIIERQLWKLIN